MYLYHYMGNSGAKNLGSVLNHYNTTAK